MDPPNTTAQQRTAQHETARHTAAQRTAGQRNATRHTKTRHSTAQPSAARRSTAQPATPQQDTPRHDTARQSRAHGSPAQNSTGLHSKAQRNTIRHTKAHHSTKARDANRGSNHNKPPHDPERNGKRPQLWDNTTPPHHAWARGHHTLHYPHHQHYHCPAPYPRGAKTPHARTAPAHGMAAPPTRRSTRLPRLPQGTPPPPYQ